MRKQSHQKSCQGKKEGRRIGIDLVPIEVETYIPVRGCWLGGLLPVVPERKIYDQAEYGALIKELLPKIYILY